MYIFKIHDKEYKVRFTYRTICKENVLDKFTSALDFKDLSKTGEVVDKFVRACAETLIAGLQKYHSDEFGYKDEKEYEALIERFYDLFDDYEDESTEEHQQSAFTLFSDLQNELEKNGFLSALAKAGEEMEQTAQKVETAKTEMEQAPVRTTVIDMTPTESKS